MRNRDFPRPYPFSQPEQESPSLLTLLIVVNFAAFALRTLFVVETGPAELAPAGFSEHAGAAHGALVDGVYPSVCSS